MYFSMSTPKEHGIEILLFCDVSNARDVMKAMKENQIHAALIDATMVI